MVGMEHSEYKSSSSGLVLQLHPLVLLNVSDHWTRMRMSAGGSSNRQDENGNTNKSKDNGTAVGSPRVVGCLLGTQHGRVVEIVNSFEMVFDESEKIDVGQAGISSSSKSNDKSQIGIKIDEEFLGRKQDQYKQVFPQLEVVGWYSTGSEVKPSDMVIHRSVAAINENPLYLLFDTAIRVNESKHLPVYVFESEVRIGSDSQTETGAELGSSSAVDAGTDKALHGSSLVFVKSSYTIETVEAERIAVDQVAKIETGSGQANSVSVLSSHLTGVHSAVKMLHARIKVIYQYLLDTKNQAVPTDHYLLRQIASISHSFPSKESMAFRDEFVREHNDTMLVTYLSMMTNGTNELGNVVEKINLVYDRDRKDKGFRRSIPISLP